MNEGMKKHTNKQTAVYHQASEKYQPESVKGHAYVLDRGLVILSVCLPVIPSFRLSVLPAWPGSGSRAPHLVFSAWVTP